MGRFAIGMKGFVLLCLWAVVAEAQYMKYKDPKQPMGTRIKDLMRRMTLEEKIGQMSQIEARLALPDDTMKKYFIDVSDRPIWTGVQMFYKNKAMFKYSTSLKTLDELPLEAETVERGYSIGTDPTGLPKIHGLPTSSLYNSSGSTDSYTASPKNPRSCKSSHSGELQSPVYAGADSNGGGRNSLGLYPTVDM